MNKKYRNRYKHLDFTFIDMLCLQIAFIISYMIRHNMESPYVTRMYGELAILLIFVHICIVFFGECYSGVLRRGFLKEFKSVVKYNFVLFGCILIFMFMMQRSGEYSRMVLVLYFIINCSLMYGVRLFYKAILKRRMQDSRYGKYMYLITTKKLLRSTIASLAKNEYREFKLYGAIVLDEDMTGSVINNVPVVANKDDFLGFLGQNIVDEVFISIPMNYKDVNQVVDSCMEMGITVNYNLEKVNTSMNYNSVIKQINKFIVITSSINAVSHRQIFLKRAMDIVGAIVGLVPTGIAFLIFAPIIYRQSKGPILFSQIRVGRNGRTFKIYKFRSMYIDAEERKKELMEQNKMQGLMFKLDYDPRIIPIGHFMRKFSIDELPQFWNVLKGEMSLVGTRPPTIDEYVRYKGHHKSRLAIKPGLTGMWQVSGRSDITDFEEVVKLDRKYITEWALGLDFKILLKTVKVVLKRDGAT